ncbi:hypothetical protein ABPG72_012129 [Tetrahymena utriculariae]
MSSERRKKLSVIKCQPQHTATKRYERVGTAAKQRTSKIKNVDTYGSNQKQIIASLLVTSILKIEKEQKHPCGQICGQLLTSKSPTPSLNHSESSSSCTNTIKNKFKNYYQVIIKKKYINTHYESITSFREQQDDRLLIGDPKDGPTGQNVVGWYGHHLP